jgi:hypothetical protein
MVHIPMTTLLSSKWGAVMYVSENTAKLHIGSDQLTGHGIIQYRWEMAKTFKVLASVEFKVEQDGVARDSQPQVGFVTLTATDPAGGRSEYGLGADEFGLTPARDADGLSFTEYNIGTDGTSIRSFKTSPYIRMGWEIRQGSRVVGYLGTNGPAELWLEHDVYDTLDPKTAMYLVILAGSLAIPARWEVINDSILPFHF